MASFRLRLTGKGEKRYHVQIRLRGAPSVCATFDNLGDAREWAVETEGAIRRSMLLPQLEARRHTLADAIDRFTLTHLPLRKKSTQRTTGLTLQWWRRTLGEYNLIQITPARIAAARDEMAALGRTPATRNRYVAALSAVLRVAAREWCWIQTNPCSRITRLKEPPGRIRFLRQEEIPRLLAECRASGSRRLYPAVALSLAVGLRLGELLDLSWQDVDLAARTITIRESEKTGQPRTLPIPADVADELRSLRAGMSIVKLTGRVFDGRRPGSRWPGFRGAFDRACRQAGITDFRWHDLRHSCGSYLAMRGVPIRTIAEILGHRNIQMTQRYTHFTEQHLRDAIEEVARDLLGKTPPGHAIAVEYDADLIRQILGQDEAGKDGEKDG